MRRPAQLARPRDDRPAVERGLRIAVTVIPVIYRGCMWPELVPHNQKKNYRIT
jgi:hypothetical protein